MTDDGLERQTPRWVSEAPTRYHLSGTAVTISWVLMFFVGPEVPYIFPKNDLIHSIGTSPYFLAVFTLTIPMWVLLGTYGGHVFWAVHRGGSDA